MHSGLVTFLAIVLVPIVAGHGATIHVPADQPTIQAGIDVALNGDTVLVAPGTYVENIDFLGKAVSVKSSVGAETTVIDGGSPPDPDHGSVVSFHSGEGADSVLEGFQLTHGSGTYHDTDHCGGGVFCYGSAPTLLNNKVTENSVGFSGGGIFCDQSSPTLTGNTIIDNSADSRGGGISCIDSSFPVLTGNTITGNTALAGGGITCWYSSPIVADNTIYENTALSGGGIYCYESSPDLMNNTFILNNAFYGGGIYCTENSSPLITNNDIIGNSGNSGGGFFCVEASPIVKDNTITLNLVDVNGGGICCYDSSPTISNNHIAENTADYGGGICCHYAASPSITCNTVTENTADYGGGICCRSLSSPTITDSTIHENSADYNGGGISCIDSSSPVITNSFISGNSSLLFGGAISCNKSNPGITNSSITGNSAANDGGGVYSYYHSSPIVTNTILWDNTALAGSEIWIGKTAWPSSLTISYSDVEGGPSLAHVEAGCTLDWGPGMIDADPLFVDQAEHDLHLTFTSPCRDTGDNGAVSELHDFEGDPRIAWDGIVDMGADEFHTRLYYTGDAIPGQGIHVKFIGNPANEAALFLGTDFLNQSIPTVHGDWWLVPPYMAFHLGPMPWNGVIVLPQRIPPDCPVPFTYPVQGMIRGILTNLCKLEVR